MIKVTAFLYNSHDTYPPYLLTSGGKIYVQSAPPRSGYMPSFFRSARYLESAVRLGIYRKAELEIPDEYLSRER